MKPTNEADVLAAAVSKVLASIATAEIVPLRDRLAYTESEAAALIGVAPYVLRDERLRGNIRCKKVGRRVFYTPQALTEFLSA